MFKNVILLLIGAVIGLISALGLSFESSKKNQSKFEPQCVIEVFNDDGNVVKRYEGSYLGTWEKPESVINYELNDKGNLYIVSLTHDVKAVVRLRADE